MSAVEKPQVKDAPVREAAEKLPPLTDAQVQKVAALLSLAPVFHGGSQATAR